MAVPEFTKNRISSLSDGVFAFVLTLLVLELKLPDIADNDHAILDALAHQLPRLLIWLLSFWVIALFYLAQLRIYRLSTMLDWRTVWIELVMLSLITLMPFSTALYGNHGGSIVASAVYAGHLVLLAAVSAWRTFHLVGHTELHEPELTPAVARALKIRVAMLFGCAAATLVLAFVCPPWNPIAMAPMALARRFAPLS